MIYIAYPYGNYEDRVEFGEDKHGAEVYAQEQANETGREYVVKPQGSVGYRIFQPRRIGDD
jgi:hypothetical protein